MQRGSLQEIQERAKALCLSDTKLAGECIQRILEEERGYAQLYFETKVAPQMRQERIAPRERAIKTLEQQLEPQVRTMLAENMDMAAAREQAMKQMLQSQK